MKAQHLIGWFALCALLLPALSALAVPVPCPFGCAS